MQLFIQDNDFKMDIINKHNVSNDFKKSFIGILTH